MSFFSSGGGSNLSPINVASFENGAIRVKKGIITGARIEQDARISDKYSGEPHDVALRLTVGYGGDEGWTREEYFGGWLKREKTAHGYGPPVDMGNAWGVAFALQACGVDLQEAESAAGVDLRNDFSKDNVLAVFEEGVQQDLVGNTIYLLDYAKGVYKGKVSYGTWRTIEAPRGDEEEEEAAERLYNRWNDQRSRGYTPKNFKPEVVEQVAAMNEAAPVEEAAPEKTEATPF